MRGMSPRMRRERVEAQSRHHGHLLFCGVEEKERERRGERGVANVGRRRRRGCTTTGTGDREGEERGRRTEGGFVQGPSEFVVLRACVG